MIIVVGIISILSVAILTIINPLEQLQKANDSKRKSDISQLKNALELYYQDAGVYPPNPGPSDYRIKGLDGNPVDWGTSWKPFISILPKDPNSSKTYVYFSSSAGQAYWLYASLDRETDPSSCNDGAACSSLSANSIAADACGGTCNFGLSSPNVSP